MTSRIDHIRTLRSQFPGYSFCLAYRCWGYSHIEGESGIDEYWELWAQKQDGIDKGAHYRGDDPLVCISLFREAVQTADQREIKLSLHSRDCKCLECTINMYQ